MKLSLSQVPAGGCPVAFKVDSTLLADAAEGMAGADPVRVAGRAEREGSALRVTGTLETRLRLTCSRCLEVFDLPVKARFDVTYSPIVPGGDEVELGARDLTVCHLDGETVDLAEMVHEQVLLAVPMAPVCRPDCKGLCPHCGANLNQGACGCAQGAADPRFDVLRKLRPGQG
jgi:uncharacterized protein